MVMKVYHDGDNLLIEIDNCTGKRAENVKKVLADILFDDISEKTIEDIKPIAASDRKPDVTAMQAETVISDADVSEKETVPESGSVSEDPEKAIEEKNWSVLSQLYHSHGLSAKFKADIGRMLFAHVSDFTELSQFTTLCNDYGPIISKDLQKILETTGFGSAEELIQYGEHKTVDEAMETLKSTICEDTI